MGWSSSVLELIGNTPMVELHSFDTGPCKLLVKLESLNPGGSIKDRIGRSMIDAAEKQGLISPGRSVLVEATAGNTGLGLAQNAALKGYRLILVIPDKMSQEKVKHLRALGAEVVMTRSDVGLGHPAYYQDLAKRIAAETPGGFYVDQFNNQANPLAHELTTGPEIWSQTEGAVTAVVCGVGSSGTITGLSRFFAKTGPHVEMVLADPVGSVLVDYIKSGKIGTAGSWLVEGIGEDFIPAIADFSKVKHGYSVSDEEAMNTTRQLLTREGILAGPSSGVLVASAVRYCQEQKSPGVVVTFICDTGNKYLSKVFDDRWMRDNGFLAGGFLAGGFPAGEKFGDLRDLIVNPASTGALISVAPSDSLASAFSRMRQGDVSQLPVIADGEIVGIIDESDVLLATQGNPDAFLTEAQSVMSSELVFVERTQNLEHVLSVLDQGLVALVKDELGFHGLITRSDVIAHLRNGYVKRQRGA